MWSIMNKNVGKYVVLILNAVLSDIMISVGGAVYLMCENTHIEDLCLVLREPLVKKGLL